MSTITTKDGRQIYYKDWGTGPAVTFSHGWPLNADAWDGQMFFLAQHGFRVVAHDRRGHGRSTQTPIGNDMNGYADDLAAVIDALDLNDVTLVGHSTGGGEVARYIGRYGTERVAKAVLIAAVPPLMLKTDDNPEGLPIEVFDKMRADLGHRRDRADGGGDRGAADLGVDGLAVQPDRGPVGIGGHLDPRRPGHLDDPRRILGRLPGAEDRQRDGPVHRAGVEIAGAERGGEAAGHRRLPGAGGSVKRHDTGEAHSG